MVALLNRCRCVKFWALGICFMVPCVGIFQPSTMGKHLSDIQHSGEQVTAILLTKLVTRQIYWSVPMDRTRPCDNASCRMSTIVMPDMSPIGLVNETELEQMLPLSLLSDLCSTNFPTRTFSICDPWWAWISGAWRTPLPGSGMSIIIRRPNCSHSHGSGE